VKGKGGLPHPLLFPLSISMERGSPCPSVLRPQGRRKGIHPEGDKGGLKRIKDSSYFRRMFHGWQASSTVLPQIALARNTNGQQGV